MGQRCGASKRMRPTGGNRHISVARRMPFVPAWPFVVRQGELRTVRDAQRPVKALGVGQVQLGVMEHLRAAALLLCCAPL